MADTKCNVVFCQNDEEINQKTSSDDDEEYLDVSAALTVDENNDTSFIVYPVGCCEFDDTKLTSVCSSKGIQKCILRLSNQPCKEENYCWGLSQSDPIYMKLMEDQLQFTALNTRALLRNQPLSEIKSWAVDDENNFAFVVESDSSDANLNSNNADLDQPVPAELALLKEPSLFCYVFRSLDDDDMSYRIASKLNEEFNRRREQMLSNIARSNRLQQPPIEHVRDEIGEEVSEMEEIDKGNNELSVEVKYLGATTVKRPSGIDILNVAIDKCLADHSSSTNEESSQERSNNNAKIHISPSSIIVENMSTGDIIVECRVRYLTFMGISRRDVRWMGFIMQNPITRHFEVHCLECNPSAGPICEAIQQSCSNMYEKVLKSARQPETLNIIPRRSKIRETFAKTFSRIKQRI